MQMPNDKCEFYEPIYLPGAHGGRFARTRAVASILLCAMASYMAGSVIAADTTQAEASSAIEEAAYVMSYIEDGVHDSEDTAEAGSEQSRIRELAEEYIREHTNR